MKNCVFWEVTPCGSCKNTHFLQEPHGVTSQKTPFFNVPLFVWLLPLDLSGLGGPTSNYATAGTALRVSGALQTLPQR
jgi:hypothetical protein